MNRRAPSGWWNTRAQQNNYAPRPRYNFDLYGPQRAPVKSAPTVPAKRTVQARAEKFTAIEKDLVMHVKTSLEISPRHPHWGYVKKLIARGLFKEVSRRGNVRTFAPTEAGHRARMGFERVLGKTLVAVGKETPTSRYEAYVRANATRVASMLAQGLQ